MILRGEALDLVIRHLNEEASRAMVLSFSLAQQPFDPIARLAVTEWAANLLSTGRSDAGGSKSFSDEAALIAFAAAADSETNAIVRSVVGGLHSDLRSKYLTYIGELRGLNALPVLAQYLNDRSTLVRDTVRSSLSWNGGPLRRAIGYTRLSLPSIYDSVGDVEGSREFHFVPAPPYKAILVGASGSGKSTISHILSSEQFSSRSSFDQVIDLDYLVFKRIFGGDPVASYGIEWPIQQFPWALIQRATVKDVIDAGALALLSPMFRGILRQSRGLNIALTAEPKELVRRLAAAPTHPAQHLLQHSASFVTSILGLRQVIARTVADVEIATDGQETQTVAESVALTISGASARLDSKLVGSVDSYPEYGTSTSGYYPEPSPAVTKLASDHQLRESNVLDIGGGSGRNSIFCALLGANVVMVEPSVSGAQAARRMARSYGVSPRLTVYEESAEKFLGRPQMLPSRLGEFDFALAMTTLSHMESSVIHGLVLPTLAQSLRSGGLLLMSAFLDDDPGALGDPDASPTAGYVRTYFDPDELLESISDVLTVVWSRRIRKFDVSHGPRHEHSVLEILAERRT